MTGSATGTGIGRLVRLLVEGGIVDGDAALAGRVAVTDLSRSNPVGLVTVDGEPVAVVKGGTVSVDGVDALAAEHAALTWIGGGGAAGTPRGAHMRGTTRRAGTGAVAEPAPRLIAGVAPRAAVVTEYVDGAQSLHEALADAIGGRSSKRLIRALGAALGTVHRAPGSVALVERRPWIFGVADGLDPDVFAGNAAMWAMFAEIRGRGPLRAAIQAFAGDWTSSAGIHGDVKFDNVLVRRSAGWRADDGAKRLASDASEVTAEAALVIVDWELAGRGDPAWDLAGVADGLLVPGLVAGEGLSWARAGLASEVAQAALDAHAAVAGPAHTPSADHLDRALVTRLAQTATQLAAMGADDPDAADAAPLVLDAATTFATSLAHAGPSRSPLAHAGPRRSAPLAHADARVAA